MFVALALLCQLQAAVVSAVPHCAEELNDPKHPESEDGNRLLPRFWASQSQTVSRFSSTNF